MLGPLESSANASDCGGGGGDICGTVAAASTAAIFDFFALIFFYTPAAADDRFVNAFFIGGGAAGTSPRASGRRSWRHEQVPHERGARVRRRHHERSCGRRIGVRGSGIRQERSGTACHRR
jgi:hypothetical protein